MISHLAPSGLARTIRTLRITARKARRMKSFWTRANRYSQTKAMLSARVGRTKYLGSHLTPLATKFRLQDAALPRFYRVMKRGTTPLGM